MRTDAFTDYLASIGRIPLLTAAEEIQLGNLVQAYFGAEDKEAVSPLVKRRALRARDRMVQANLRLVVTVAKKFSRPAKQEGLGMLDLVQEGSVGLVRGAEKFDPARGYKFSTYAYWWIRQGITRALSTGSVRGIRVSAHVRDLVNKARRLMAQRQAEGGTVSLADIADELGIDQERLSEAMSLTARARQVYSLDGAAKLDDGDGAALIDLVADPNSELEVDFDRQLVQDALLALAPDHQDLLKRTVIQQTSMTQIGQETGVSREAIRLRREKALRQLRREIGFRMSA